MKSELKQDIEQVVKLVDNQKITWIEGVEEIERLVDKNYYNPDKQVAIIWSIQDVKSVRPHLTNEQAMKVLEHVKRSHDATIGVSWETLEITSDMLFPRPI